VEESDCDIIWGTIPTMASRVSGKLQHSSPRIASLRAGIWTQHHLSTNQQCNRVDRDVYI